MSEQNQKVDLWAAISHMESRVATGDNPKDTQVLAALKSAREMALLAKRVISPFPVSADSGYYNRPKTLEAKLEEHAKDTRQLISMLANF